MTSGCHGGAGLDRGAYTIFKRFDPHSEASATLTNGRSNAMARQLGIENAAESKSCTICHSPMSQVPPSRMAAPPEGHAVDSGVSCANCHGPEENWLLSHTRPDYPKDALARLGMRQLGSAYQRANNCVACHQNLSDELVKAKHPPLVFELDGLLVAEPKHWREEEGFSNTKTWLVGQAVALRETAAQANREPGERRSAEIEAIGALLKATGTGWNDSSKDLVRAADEYAKRISSGPMSQEQTRTILSKLIGDRSPFQADAFSAVAPGFRSWSVGYYAERLTLAIDRLNQSLVAAGQPAVIGKELLDALFDAAKPPESFDADTADQFVKKLDRISLHVSEQGR
ncbi:MAG: multiheme c-type cytochrome [Luteolibacter sp.]|uniref:multiheme c-type cytochrome n=1 Tax=Luteolibacter sp. TaxID=1962973 RepID=UPI003262DB1F